MTDLEYENQELKDKIQSLEKELGETEQYHRDEIATLNDTIVDLRDEVETLQDKLNDLQALVDELE